MQQRFEGRSTMVVGGAVRQRSKQEKWDWDSRWERKGERGRGREREDNRFSPNLTLSINLTSSSRRKGPVCPGTLPDSRRVRHRAHTRHHYLPGRASPRDRRGTPRRPLGNTLPPLPTLLDSFVDQPSLGRFCPRPFSPQHRRWHSPLDRSYIFRPEGGKFAFKGGGGPRLESNGKLDDCLGHLLETRAPRFTISSTADGPPFGSPGNLFLMQSGGGRRKRARRFYFRFSLFLFLFRFWIVC